MARLYNRAAMAPKVPVIPDRGEPSLREPQNQQSISPLGLGVERERDMIVLQIEASGWTGVISLSPPTAYQLARTLRRAVKDYLNSQETE